MFEPTTLLKAISLAPSIAASVLTASSGALVPIATIVSPMIIADTRKTLARAALPSTKMSAPLISATKPAARISRFRKIMFLPFPPVCRKKDFFCG